MGTGAVFKFGYYEQSCYKHLCTSLFQTRVFISHGYLPKSRVTGSEGKYVLNSVRNCQNFSQSDSYHFTLHIPICAWCLVVSYYTDPNLHCSEVQVISKTNKSEA